MSSNTQFQRRRPCSRIVAVTLVAVMLAAAAGCSSVSTMTDFDETYDFGALGTFAISPRSRAGTGADRPERAAPLTLVDKRIRAAVQSQLREKGFREADPAAADFIVHYNSGTREHLQVMPYAYHPRPRPWLGPTAVHHWTEGTLVLDLVDRRANELVWRGVAKGAIQDMNPREGELAEVVAKLLKKFPPER